MVKDVSFADFLSEVKTENRKIVLYGFGVIGKVVAPEWLCEHGLALQMLFVTDADKHKQGEQLRIGGRNIAVVPPQALSKIKEPFCILLTVSRYARILEYLEKQPYFDETPIYIFPQMLSERCRLFLEKPSLRQGKIPKVIHYCWFGRMEIPQVLQHYMASWRRFCPDYEIVCWNEDNFDIHKYPYTEQAYRHGKLGFVPDVVRLEVLYEHGGIYLDTDVELLRPLDDLLDKDAFCGVEKWGTVNIGGGCGVVAGHPMIGAILKFRKDEMFERRDGSLNLETCGYYETIPFLELGFRPNNTTQIINGMTIYRSDFFHPYDYMSKETCLTENTYSIHHFYGSWV